MMKNKSKKQEDEGSTQSNLSRYELMYFTHFLASVVIVYPDKHGWSLAHVF